MRFSTLLRVLCIFCGLLVQCFAIDREAFTFTSYDLEARVEPDQHRLAVRGKITLRNDSSSPQKNLALQISSSLSWRSIQVNSKPVEFTPQPYASDIDHTGALSEAIVTLSQEIPPKGTIELEIGYEGVVLLDTSRLTRIGVPVDTAKHSDWDQIGKTFSAVRGIGYVAWYPVATESANLSEGNSVFETVGRWKAREAQSSFSVNLCQVNQDPKTQTSLMNDRFHGAPAGSSGGSDPGASWLCTEHVFAPLAQTTPAFALTGYTILNQSALDIYYLPTHRSDAEGYALALDLAAPFVTDWFGSPQERARVADLADADATPFETGSLLFMPLTASADSRLAQMTAVHQLTHVAFPSPRPWIYEGLAHFAQAAYRERQSGRQAALDFMGLHRTAIADAEKMPASDAKSNASAEQSLLNSSVEEFYRSKAMYVWWMLRDMIGEDAMKKALAAYRPEQDKESAYMQHLVEASSKRDLEGFFDDWVYRDRGLPDFRVESAFPRPTVGGGHVVTITVENLGGAGAEVPVTLRIEGGEISKRLRVPAKSTAAIRIEAPSVPREVVVNDGSVPESDMSNNAFKVELPAK